jgi:hypothetical protein
VCGALIAEERSSCSFPVKARPLQRGQARVLGDSRRGEEAICGAPPHSGDVIPALWGCGGALSACGKGCAYGISRVGR